MTSILLAVNPPEITLRKIIPPQQKINSGPQILGMVQVDRFIDIQMYWMVLISMETPQGIIRYMYRYVPTGTHGTQHAQCLKTI